MAVIRRFARQVVRQFRPDKIILFGSHAYGAPHEDSDVDILVIMAARNQVDQAFKTHATLLPPFPLDIIVRTPRNLEWRLAEGDSFHTEIMSKGKVLRMKRLTRDWVRKADADYDLAATLARGRMSFHDQQCFHCQQAADTTESLSPCDSFYAACWRLGSS
jgi:predicted nucleotidyltransferase